VRVARLWKSQVLSSSHAGMKRGLTFQTLERKIRASVLACYYCEPIVILNLQRSRGLTHASPEAVKSCYQCRSASQASTTGRTGRTVTLHEIRGPLAHKNVISSTSCSRSAWTSVTSRDCPASNQARSRRTVQAFREVDWERTKRTG
jgi:hypothetical protein